MRWRPWMCVALFGGHEDYRAWTRERMFQQCIRCGRATPGWDVRPSFRYWSTWMR